MMASKLSYTTLAIDGFGWVAVSASDRGLLRLTLPQATENIALISLGNLAGATRLSSHFSDLIERLRAYFRGESAVFSDSLDLNAATPFQRAVWLATQQIPYGETRSYGWLAARVNSPRAARAIGQAMASNPVPIIVPCHRVIGSDGGLTGFGGGLAMKERLLSLEVTARRQSH
jgi:methylated-DNA-[protein]-cysteine S-methyltransferase